MISILKFVIYILIAYGIFMATSYGGEYILGTAFSDEHKTIFGIGVLTGILVTFTFNAFYPK